MKGFSGFPDGKQRVTLIPNVFFSDLLPAIDNLAELKVTLYAFWALTQREGRVRYLRQADFLDDPILVEGMAPIEKDALDAVLDGIERAVARRTFLHITVEGAKGQTDLYFLNTEKGRAAIEGITQGAWRPNPDDEEPVTLLVERPNIFVLYEQNIGALTPMIADELREAETTYPMPWIEEAIKIAVESNKRSWRYARAILESWRLEGRKDAKSQQDSQRNLLNQIPPGYEDIVQH